MLITNVPKGEQFSFIMTSNVSFTTSTPYAVVPGDGTDLSGSTKTVYKDNGSGASMTNAPSFLTAGAFLVTLTAAEMDADVIDVVVNKNTGNKFLAHVRIQTGVAESGGGDSGDCMKLTDVIDINTDSPLDECTVEGLLAILVRRLKRGSQKL